MVAECCDLGRGGCVGWTGRVRRRATCVSMSERFQAVGYQVCHTHARKHVGLCLAGRAGDGGRGGKFTFPCCRPTRLCLARFRPKAGLKRGREIMWVAFDMLFGGRGLFYRELKSEKKGLLRRTTLDEIDHRGTATPELQ